MLIRFASVADRDEFLSRLQLDAVDIFNQARATVAQPTSMSFRDLTETQERWLIERAEAFDGAKLFPALGFPIAI